MNRISKTIQNTLFGAFLALSIFGKADAYKSAPALAPVSPGLITHGARTHRIACLTFDACETHKVSGYDAHIIAILTQTHTPATLMLGGHWMESHPAATQQLAANPLFEIGSHSYLHPHMTKITPNAVREDLKKTQNVMFAMTGKQGTLFRPPYGEFNQNVLNVAAQLGLRTITWEVVTGDPDKHVTARDIIRTVDHKVRPGSIVIMHMNGRGWHTAEALPGVIHDLRARGYTFVTVSQALAEK